MDLIDATVEGPILDSAAPVSAVIGRVEPYYILNPDHLHKSVRAELWSRDSPLGVVGCKCASRGISGRRREAIGQTDGCRQHGRTIFDSGQ
jgi:hypothetical protein